MTIPNKIVELAVEGGYPLTLSTSGVNYSDMILSPLFWQSLGKQLGWDKEDEQNLKMYRMSGGAGDMPKGIYRWNKKVHRFIDLLLTGGDTDAFWEGLIDKK